MNQFTLVLMEIATACWISCSCSASDLVYVGKLPPTARNANTAVAENLSAACCFRLEIGLCARVRFGQAFHKFVEASKGTIDIGLPKSQLVSELPLLPGDVAIAVVVVVVVVAAVVAEV